MYIPWKASTSLLSSPHLIGKKNIWGGWVCFCLMSVCKHSWSSDLTLSSPDSERSDYDFVHFQVNHILNSLMFSWFTHVGFNLHFFNNAEILNVILLFFSILQSLNINFLILFEYVTFMQLQWSIQLNILFFVMFYQAKQRKKKVFLLLNLSIHEKHNTDP